MVEGRFLMSRRRWREGSGSNSDRDFGILFGGEAEIGS